MNNDHHASTLQINGPLHFIMDHASEYKEQDELDLSQLFSRLYKKRTLIITITILSILLASIIAFIIPPVYRVQTTLLAPTEDQIQKLYLNTDSTITNTQLFQIFTKKLASSGNVILYLEQSGLIDEALNNSKLPVTKKVRINALNKLAKNYQTTFIHHLANDTKDNFKDNSQEATLTTFSSQFHLDPKNNLDYLAYTNQQVLNEISKEQHAIVDKKIIQLQNQIDQDITNETLRRISNIKQLEEKHTLKLATLKAQIEALNQRDRRDRELELQELNNALKIATALGINNPNSANQPRMNSQDTTSDTNNNQSNLYLRGTRYLQNQIEIIKSQPHSIGYDKKLSALQEKIDILNKDPIILALKNRADDKPYVKNIEKKETELKHLKELSFDLANVKVYTMDGQPHIETSPIKPKKLLIIFLGFVLGIVLALFVVLTQSIMQKRTSNNRFS